jgi:nitroreductase
MDVLLALESRHSVKKVKPDPVPREWVEKLLAVGNAAPNHHHVRPWRFVVLSGNARTRLGDVMAASQRERKADLPPEASEKTRSLPLRAPLLIAVGVDKPSDERTVEIENVCAAAAACENILLAAQELGLGAIWRTGEWAEDVKVKEFLGFAPDQHVIAFLYIGFPDGETSAAPRPSVQDHVTWME